MRDALFVPDGERWLPTDAARGPWSPLALHGGPVAALIAGAAEATGNRSAAGPMHPARLTVELLRPVPVTPLALAAEVTRPGRKVQIVGVHLTDTDGTRVASASPVQIRRQPVDLPDQPPPPAPPPPPSAGRPLGPAVGDYAAFHNEGVEHRFVAGHFEELGPATDWIRLRLPVTPGDEPTPLQRVAAAADFGNGVSAMAPFAELTFINPDLTVYLHRLPAGEWVCIDAATRLEPHGVAVADSTLYDEGGPLGRALQSLLLERPG